MRRSDPLLMLADIAQVASERPELDETTVQALYQNLVLTQGKQPTIDEARDYVDRLISNLGEHALRRRLGLGPRRKRRRQAPVTPRRGRPKGSGQLSLGAVTASYSALRSERNRRPTQPELASRLDVAVRTLQDFLKANGLRWPLAD